MLPCSRDMLAIVFTPIAARLDTGSVPHDRNFTDGVSRRIPLFETGDAHFPDVHARLGRSPRAVVPDRDSSSRPGSEILHVDYEVETHAGY